MPLRPLERRLSPTESPWADAGGCVRNCYHKGLNTASHLFENVDP
jgi:hypothetical protein